MNDFPVEADRLNKAQQVSKAAYVMNEVTVH